MGFGRQARRAAASYRLKDGLPVRVLSVLLDLPRRTLLLAIRVYQHTFSLIIPPVCRFEPSCSRYAYEAIQRHGALRGTWLAVRRLGRCQPWGGSGYDPVP
jgi:putative membrane protein insertion efficiency factor